MVSAFLNQITMYRLMTYFLIGLVLWAVLLSFIGVLPFNGIDIVLSGLYLIFVCYLSNKLLSKIFKVSPNTESFLITALILTLIIGPEIDFKYLSLAAV